MYEPEPMDDDLQPEVFTRVYVKNNGGSYDLDGDLVSHILDAIGTGKKTYLFANDSIGEQGFIMLDNVEAVILRTKDSLRQTWLQEKAWEKYRKEVIGWEGSD